jgi:hypothetical protein
MNFVSLHYFLRIKTIEKRLKTSAQYWAESSPRPKANWVRRPTVAAGHHSLTVWGRNPAASSVRPALPSDATSALPPWSPCTECPRWRSRRQLVPGQGAAALAARAPARYRGPTGQHEGGEGSPGRWHNCGVAESSSVDGVQWRWWSSGGWGCS